MTYIIIFLTCIVSIASFRNRALLDKLILKPYDVVHKRQWYRLLTHGLIHADYTHLFVNMLVLLSFGSNIERLFKSYQHAGTISSSYLTYILLYFGGMIIASLYDVINRRNDRYYSSLGASGAVAAVLFCSIFFDPWGMIYFFGIIPIPGILFGVLYVAYSQYMGKRSADHINHFAHLYGALYGFIFPLLIDPKFISLFLENISRFK